MACPSKPKSLELQNSSLNPVDAPRSCLLGCDISHLLVTDDYIWRRPSATKLAFQQKNWPYTYIYYSHVTTNPILQVKNYHSVISQFYPSR